MSNIRQDSKFMLPIWKFSVMTNRIENWSKRSVSSCDAALWLCWLMTEYTETYQTRGEAGITPSRRSITIQGVPKLIRHWLGGKHNAPVQDLQWLRHAFLHTFSDINLTPSVKVWRWSVECFRVISIFVATLHADFGRKVLNVLKFVKSRASG